MASSSAGVVAGASYMFFISRGGIMKHFVSAITLFVLKRYEIANAFIITTSCMSFVADLRDAIYGLHFADRRLSQLPTPQAASSLSHNHRAEQRCFCL